MLEITPLKHEFLVQKEDTRKLVSKLDEVYSLRLKAMREHYRQWQLNLAFERGRQWCKWDRVYGKIVDLRPSKARKSRVVFNLIGPFVRSTISMLSQSSTTKDVVPASFSAKDERVAKSAQAHLNRIDIVNQKSINDILLRKNVTDFGTAFKIVYWNDTPNIETLYEGQPTTPEELVEIGEPLAPVPLKDKNKEERMERIRRGEVGEVICSPFEILLDYPLVRVESQIRDFIRYRLVSLDYIKNSWKLGKHVSSENITNYQILSELLNSDNDLFDTHGHSNQVVLKEYFEVQSKKYPQGRHIQWANGILLHDGVLSHPKGRLGLFSYHWNIDSNDFYGESYVQPLIEPQIIVNRILSKATDWLGTSVRFRVALPRNAQFSRNKFVSSDDGDVFEYNNIGGTGLINIPIPPIPPGLFSFQDVIIQHFKDLGSRHEVSSAQVPGRVESGRAIRSLQEADSQYLVVSMIVWEERERESALFNLDLMRHYYKKGRSAAILGEGRQVEMFMLEGGELDPGIDINIVRGSAMPKSKVSQQSFIIELFQMGLFGDPADPAVKKKILRWMDVGGVSAVFGSVEIGANLQQTEIMAMKKGEYVKAQSYNDHYTHNQECLKELNMPGFNEEKDEFREMVVRHWQEHSQFILEMNKGIPPGMIEEPKPTPMPGAGGKIGLPEAVNPEAQMLAG